MHSFENQLYLSKLESLFWPYQKIKPVPENLSKDFDGEK